MPPPGRGRGRGRGRPGPHRPHAHPHRPHAHPHPVPKPAPVHPHPHPVAKAVPEVWNRLYEWADQKIIVVQHSLGKHLRVNPNNKTVLDFEGGTGIHAHWKCHVHEHGNVIQLQSVDSGKFLRMKPNGNDFDVNGLPKGPNTYFMVEKKSRGVAFLKTKKTFHNNQHAYLAVMHGQLAQKRLKFFIKGASREWQKPYNFAKKNTAVIEHTQGFKHLRADPDRAGGVDGEGGTGKWARWEVDPDHQNHTVRFKNLHTGGYLRIHGKDGGELSGDGKGGKFTIFKIHQIGDEKNHVKLESLAHPGKFVAVGKNGARVGVGGPFCALTLYRE